MIADMIMDIGAHNGDDSAYYLSKGYNVVAVEANPAQCAQLRNRFASESRFHLVEAAVFDTEGKVDFWINNKHTEWSSIIQSIGEREGGARKISVPSITPRSLFDQFGVPYYLKIDIEKADIYCLRAINPSNRPAYVSVEAHELEYLFLLQSVGYNAFKCIDQTRHNNTRIHRFTQFWDTWGKIKRRISKVRFPFGSSGPLPEETVGQWQGFDQTAYEWLHHHFGIQRRTNLCCKSWIDFHATVQ